MSETRPNDTIGTAGEGWTLDYGHRLTHPVTGTCIDCGSNDHLSRTVASVSACPQWPGSLCVAGWWDDVTAADLPNRSADHWLTQAGRVPIKTEDWEYVAGDPVVCARFTFNGEPWEVRYGMNRAGYVSGPNAIRAFPVSAER